MRATCWSRTCRAEQLGMRKERGKDAEARFMLEPELPSVSPLPRKLLPLLLLLLLASSPAKTP